MSRSTFIFSKSCFEVTKQGKNFVVAAVNDIVEFILTPDAAKKLAEALSSKEEYKDEVEEPIPEPKQRKRKPHPSPKNKETKQKKTDAIASIRDFRVKEKKFSGPDITSIEVPAYWGTSKPDSNKKPYEFARYDTNTGNLLNH